MTPDERRLQIAAMVSGDLSESDSRRLRAEISRDPALSELLRLLEQDRKTLRLLPLRKSPRDQSQAILAKLDEPAIIQLPERFRRKKARHGLNIAVGLAACLVVAALAWSRWREGPVGPPVALNKVDVPERREVAVNGDPPGRGPSPNHMPSPNQPSEPGKVAPSPSPHRNAEPYTSLTELNARPKQADLSRTTRVLAASDIGRGDEWQRFCSELSRDRQHRLEFFARDPARCVDAIGKALEAKRLAVLIDSSATESLGRKSHGMFLLYVEALSNADWVALLTSLTASGEAPFHDVTLAAGVIDKDRAELKALLGVDPYWKEVPADVAAPSPNGQQALVTVYPPKPGKISPQAERFLEGRDSDSASVKMCVIVRPLPSER